MARSRIYCVDEYSGLQIEIGRDVNGDWTTRVVGTLPEHLEVEEKDVVALLDEVLEDDRKPSEEDVDATDLVEQTRERCCRFAAAWREMQGMPLAEAFAEEGQQDD